MTKTPKFTRSHFQFLAGVLAEMAPPYDHPDRPQWEQSVRDMAIALTWTNDQFDRSKFLTACGV